MDRLDALAQRIGTTPVYEICRIPIPNGNRIFAKEEWLNPTGSHYDRIYLNLFRALEAEGTITRGQTRLVETSSGCAGASFAWFCHELEYPATVVVPTDLPATRIRAIQDFGADIVTSPPGQYMAGAVATLRELLAKDRLQHKSRETRFYCLNHSQDPRTLAAMHPVAHEIHSQVPGPITHFVGACGNGSSLLGIGHELKRLYSGIRVVACDPIEGPVAFNRRYPGEFERRFGIPPTFSPHRVFGTGAWGVPFPFLEGPLFNRVVDEAIVVSREDRESVLKLLHEVEAKRVGRSSALVLAVALSLASTISDSQIVIPFYDSFERYI